MKSFARAALAGACLFGLSALVLTPAEAAKCSKAGGTGYGITKEIAMANSTLALSEKQMSSGMKGRGKVASSCKSDLLLMNECTAMQRSCK
jgi:hypothetical protein